jgi:hypothetical protein
MFLMLCGFFLKNKFSDSLLTTDYDIQFIALTIFAAKNSPVLIFSTIKIIDDKERC